jgi:hypothetical protein
MTLTPVNGFKHFETHHCVTGSLRHIYAFHDHPISEDMLLGLGEGVGFIYWHMKGQDPFIGGRAAPKPSLEEIAGARTGVKVIPHTTASAAKAQKALIDLLDAGQPVMIQVDMGFLPYFDFDGQEYHFGGHVVVACGYDAAAQTVLIADRDAALHPVPLKALAQARGSTFKPFPPQNRWYTFDFSGKRLPTLDEARQAIIAQCDAMLHPPIQNMGVAGIRKTAHMIPQWAKQISADRLPWVLFNAYIFISPVGGSGGGHFRYMFSRFVRELGAHDARLLPCADQFLAVADRWAAVGDEFKQASESDHPAEMLTEISGALIEIAAMEQAAWESLRACV